MKIPMMQQGGSFWGYNLLYSDSSEMVLDTSKSSYLCFHFCFLLHFPRQHFFIVCSGISHISSEVETPPTPYVNQRRRSTQAFLYCCRKTTPPSAAAFLSRTRSAVRLTEHKFNHVQSPDNQNTHRLHSYHTHQIPQT